MHQQQQIDDMGRVTTLKVAPKAKQLFAAQCVPARRDRMLA